MLASDQDILTRLGFPAAPLLGSGGEAFVYAIGGNRIVRIMRPGARIEDAQDRASLLSEISAHARHLPFATPEVEHVQMLHGRVLALEVLLPGEPVSALLQRLEGATRRALVADYLKTARSISAIALRRDFFGPLIGGDNLRAASWSGFLAARLDQSLRACPDDLRPAVAAALDHGLPEPDRPALVHLDYFPANVLARGGRIEAVLDFGPSSIIGDARMEAWSAVAYLDTELSPAANDADRRQALDWLAGLGLTEHYPAARRWLAAYWSFASDDAALMAWCRRVLLA